MRAIADNWPIMVGEQNNHCHEHRYIVKECTEFRSRMPKSKTSERQRSLDQELSMCEKTCDGVKSCVRRTPTPSARLQMVVISEFR